MESQWVSSAINILHLRSDQIIEMPNNKAEKIREVVQATFLDCLNPQWWWEL